MHMGVEILAHAHAHHALGGLNRHGGLRRHSLGQFPSLGANFVVVNNMGNQSHV